MIFRESKWSLMRPIEIACIQSPITWAQSLPICDPSTNASSCCYFILNSQSSISVWKADKQCGCRMWTCVLDFVPSYPQSLSLYHSFQNDYLQDVNAARLAVSIVKQVVLLDCSHSYRAAGHFHLPCPLELELALEPPGVAIWSVTSLPLDTVNDLNKLQYYYMSREQQIEN